MKKITFFYYLIAVSLLAGCATDDEETTSSGGIIADFSFVGDGNTFTFTNLSEGATTYRWDFGDLYFYCDKENPVYTYTKAGGEVEVTLTAMNDSGQEAYATKTIATPEIFEIDIEINGNFDDWENVEYLYDESASGTGSMQKIKMWGAGENINVYLEGNTTMQMELVDIYFNTDGDSSTGFLSWQWPTSSGAEYLFEGPPLSGSWGAFYSHNDPSGGWGWDWLAGSGANFNSSGLVSVDAETNAIEFSIPKTQFGALGSYIGIAISELTIGWAGVAVFPEVTATSSFIIYELPSEDSIGFCE
ncbi:PKD domain-containing protein [Flavivirga aquimarina]|uniref:PKD domain-containing protein n=1 Tax=Flavivirga aquimarina TaxID=2027862 RepID=A0ABT8W7E5_9FLAO|nr:PKD domain-containing protein [Flavivirga aquimarina]MDO5968982.1 PKD domain-containing protein [Flavivirga aquimarina]